MSDTQEDSKRVLDFLAGHAGAGSARKEGLNAFSAASRLVTRLAAYQSIGSPEYLAALVEVVSARRVLATDYCADDVLERIDAAIDNAEWVREDEGPTCTAREADHE